MSATKQSEEWHHFTQLDNKVEHTLYGMKLVYYNSTSAMRTYLLNHVALQEQKDQMDDSKRQEQITASVISVSLMMTSQ